MTNNINFDFRNVKELIITPTKEVDTTIWRELEVVFQDGTTVSMTFFGDPGKDDSLQVTL